MKKILNILFSILVGVGIGYIIELIIIGISGNDIIIAKEFISRYGQFKAKLIHTSIYAGFGLVGYISSFVYDLEKISLLYSTIINLGLNVLYFLIVGLYLKWFEAADAIFAIFGFVITYFIIWTAIYFYEKSKIEKINKKLSQKS